jgi:hypothetical protein
MGLAKTLKGYLVGTLQAGWQAFVNYLPSLLTIILVVVVTLLDAMMSVLRASIDGIFWHSESVSVFFTDRTTRKCWEFGYTKNSSIEVKRAIL